ncbi:MAG: hypothetical protein K6G61_12565 [Solobacterium sp.]|nr:hypothetical protein [Solobacterium sp.]
MTEERKYDLEAFLDLQDRLDIMMHLGGLQEILKENDAWNTMLVDTTRNVTKRYITHEELEHMLGLMVLCRDITDRMPEDENVIKMRNRLDEIIAKLREQYSGQQGNG